MPMDNYDVRNINIQGEDGISEFWRRNKSTVVAKELSQLLAALRKLTGYLGMNVGSIIWEGMKQPEETSAIILDPVLIRGKYPVPAGKTDIVVGVAVREAYRRIEWGEKAERLAWEKAGWMNQDQRYKFQIFIQMAERIYLDILANRTVLGLYAEAARMHDFNQAKANFLTPPSLEELLYYWWFIVAQQDISKDPTEFFLMLYPETALVELNVLYCEQLKWICSLTRQRLNVCLTKRSVLERCHYRSELYVEQWNALIDTVKSWAADRKTKLKGDDVAPPAKAPRISDATLKAIEATLSENLDYTCSVRNICDDDKETVTIKTSKIILPMEEKLDRQLFLKLKASLRLNSRNRNVISRGLKNGKIDPRRLYRAPVTGEVFMYKKPVYELDNDIILLVDASSSMVGPKWRQSQRIFYAIFEALKELNKNTQVFAYNEAFNTCYLTKLTQDGKIYTIIPRGKTASGEAIIATALLIKKRGRLRKPLLIHLTDGASNWGSEVSYAINYCKKEKIALLTLGIGCNKKSRGELIDEYGELVEFINDIKTLPRKFTELVNNAGRTF